MFLKLVGDLYDKSKIEGFEQKQGGALAFAVIRVIKRIDLSSRENGKNVNRKKADYL